MHYTYMSIVYVKLISAYIITYLGFTKSYKVIFIFRMTGSRHKINNNSKVFKRLRTTVVYKKRKY